MKDRTERIEKVGEDRIPVSGNRDILTVRGKEPGFEYRWVLNLGNRISKFERGGWEVVTHEVSVGDARAAVPTSMGANTIVATSGGERELILMRIPEKYYKEDQDAKEQELLAVEASMGKNVEGKYGEVAISRK
jgi:hypothetical protein